MARPTPLVENDVRTVRDPRSTTRRPGTPQRILAYFFSGFVPAARASRVESAARTAFPLGGASAVAVSLAGRNPRSIALARAAASSSGVDGPSKRWKGG